MIEVVNLTKQYQRKNQKDFYAVNNLNLNFNDNEITGVVGYSGAGKSTLIRLINGLIKPSSGSVIIDGTDITKINKKELNVLRHNIGMIFQSYNLLSSLSVLDNVKLSLEIANYSTDKLEVTNRVLEVLDLVGLKDRANDYPKNLSGGQKQRVAIARAIANKPKYLLCDEITSALDNKTSLEIVSLLKEIKDKTNITIIFISHQLEIVRALCERVIVMENGFVVEDNNTIDLFINPKAGATKTLIGNIINVNNYQGKFLLKYRNEANHQTILSCGIIKYQVLVNILEAQTLNINDNIIGFMIVDFIGENQNAIIDYLVENNIEVERIWIIKKYYQPF